MIAHTPTYTKDDTLIAKAFAIILILCHHLFISATLVPSTFMGRMPWVMLSTVGKLGVCMFLLLSGYGIMKSDMQNHRSAGRFYVHAFTRIYGAFWPVFLLSLIPLLFSVGGHTFGSTWSSWWRFGLNMLGLQYLIYDWGYNPTWWFISLILVLYLIFPLVRKLIELYPITITYAAIILSFCNFAPFTTICNKFAPFIIGCLAARQNWPERFAQADIPGKATLAIASAVLFCFSRVFTLRTDQTSALLCWDILSALSLLISCWLLIRSASATGKVMIFVGRHSMNIFLVHTFICGIYLKELSYALRYPPLLIIQLLLLSIFISICVTPLQTALINGLRSPFRRKRQSGRSS